MLSAALIVTAVLMTRQVDFLRNRSIGFDREHLLVIPAMTREGDEAYRRFRQALAGEPGIEAVTATSSPMSSFRSRRSVVIGDDHLEAATLRVDYNFAGVMGLSLRAGRDFSETFPSDATDAVLVNERFLRRVGWSAEEALGQTFTFYDERPVTVVGVVQDFHLTSFHTPLEPTVLYLNPSRQVRFFLARIRPTGIPTTLTTLETTWKTLFPDRPYSYAFLEERLARQYAFEARIGTIMRYAMFFATLIACMGLFGLAALSLTRRTREIGIRKVLGATVPGLVGLVSRQFLLLVLLANLLAWPLAYFATDALLQFHAYRIDITPATFLVTGLLSLVIAFLTVSSQAIRAARANPVDSLRYE
jgi:putative ABC transport system permease protein